MSTSDNSIYHLSFKTATGKDFPLSTCKGKVILIINTATKCGFAPQFKELESLHKAYGPRGLMVIGMPSNQFASQEPVDDASMTESCKINFGVSFPLMAKADVNGPATHPVFSWLKQKAPGWLGKDIRWNFTKFLVATNGTSVQRFAPGTPPSRMKKDIEKALSPITPS